MPDRQFIRLHLNLCRQNTFHSANIFLYFFFHQGDVTLSRSCRIEEYAGMVELADAQDLGSCAARRVGSTPTTRTRKRLIFEKCRK